jgi:mRNA-degrading endonuclease RelE of RelBE toxin-antitoxin system
MYHLEFRQRAHRQLTRLARKAPSIAKDIIEKIRWLVEHVEEIEHEKLQGYPEYSLHCGQYRVLYHINRQQALVIIEDIDKHDAAYRRLRQRRSS